MFIFMIMIVLRCCLILSFVSCKANKRVGLSLHARCQEAHTMLSFVLIFICLGECDEWRWCCRCCRSLVVNAVSLLAMMLDADWHVGC